MFIKQSRKIHSLEYDYSLSRYTARKSSISIICKTHGEFKQSPDSHLKGSGCPKCALSLKFNTAQFIDKLKKVHGARYDYSKLNYIGTIHDVEIICNIHGSFWQRASAHLKGNGCPTCGKCRKHANSHTGASEFEIRAKKIHGDKYKYDDVQYVNNTTRVKIFCVKHNEYFEQMPSAHLKGSGCQRCGIERNSSIRVWTREQFIYEAEMVHGCKYGYDDVIYVGTTDKVDIICYDHGVFRQTPANHLNLNQGCPKCSHSVSEPELEIIDFINGLDDSLEVKTSDRSILGGNRRM